MTFRRLSALAFVLVLVILTLGAVWQKANAAQGSGCMPTTGTISGLTFAQDANAAFAALISSNSGASAPSTDCTAVPIKGQVWLDTSSTPNIVKQYDGASWLIIGYYDATNHIWTPPVGGGIGTLASGSTVDLGSVPQAYVSITGSTGPITSFGSSAIVGSVHFIAFASTPTVTYNATSMILPAAIDRTVEAGEVWSIAYLGSGNWRVLNQQPASGQAVVNPSVELASFQWGMFANLPSKYAYGAGQAISRATYPDYLAAVTRTQSVTRTSGSAVLTSVSDTSKLGVGMPIEGTGIPTSTTILSVTSSTITMSANASSGSPTTGNATVFLTGYGSGGDSTTVGVADCQARTVVGRDGMLGTATNRITSAGSGVNALALNTSGGAQNVSIAQANIPSYTLPSSSSGGSATLKVDVLIQSGASNGSTPTGGGEQVPSSNTYGTSQGTLLTTFVAPTVTVTSGGSGAAVNKMPPVLTTDCIVRVSR